MRYFLGLDLHARQKLAIQAWRDKALPQFRHPVPVSNFHVTNVFLGQIQDNQLDQICQAIDRLEQDAFSLHFNTLGYWSKPKILYLGCEHIPDTVETLTERLQSIARAARIVVPERKYIPHITLVRKCPEHAPAPLLPPDFSCDFTALHLFESVSGKQGVHYPIRRTWPLNTFRKPGIR